MRPRRLAPASTDDLLLLLRQARLLDDEQIRRLADAWDGSATPAPHLDSLVQAGLLTPWQAEQILTGRIGRLRLGPYRLLDRLGAGGMGQVFKAEHRLLRRLVALKILGRVRRQPRPVVAGRLTPPGSPLQTPTDPGSSPGRSRREIETVGQLSHPHIVAAHDACRLRGRLVLVLEYVEGVDLERLVRETGPLPVALACEAIRQTALALEYLHQRKLVHRDVKPANLLFTQGDNPDVPPLVKLLDLGLACPVASAGHELCGTPDYLAPERGLGSDTTDIRSDLYSLGCTFYQLLTGRVPFPGGNWPGKLLRHRLEEAPSVRELRPEVPEAVAGVVARLMARDPDERYPTPALLVEALETLPQDAPSLASARPRRSSRRLRLLIGGACILGAALGLLARMTAPRTLADTLAPRRTSTGILVSGEESAFADLASALEAARDGAILDVPDGRHLLLPVVLRGKALTLRAASGAKPVLVRPRSAGGWDALLESNRDLTLEGLTLIGGDLDGAPVALVNVERGRLRLRNCTLNQRGLAPAITVRRGPGLLIQGCEIQAPMQGVAVELSTHGKCAVTLRDSEVKVTDATGAALLLWTAEQDVPARVEVHLTTSTIRAGRILACRSLLGPVRFTATSNRLTFDQALVSFDGYPEPDSWRSVLRWQGQLNRYETTGAWLRLDGRAGRAWDERAFESLWSRQ